MFKANPNGFHMVFENGYTVSVQWGAATYSDNRNRRDFMVNTMESATAEVAVWDKDGVYVLPDQVIGYQTPADLLAILNKYAAK